MTRVDRGIRRIACCAALAAAAQLPAAPPPDIQVPEALAGFTQGDGGYWLIDFNQLASFSFAPAPVEDHPLRRSSSHLRPMFEDPPPTPLLPTTSGSVEGIPKSIQALDGQKVRVTGFMLPTRLDKGMVKEFLLIRSQLTCCFGVPPAPNEWVIVSVDGKGVEQKMDVPLNVYGVFRVGAVIQEGQFCGLYRLQCEKVAIK